MPLLLPKTHFNLGFYILGEKLELNQCDGSYLSRNYTKPLLVLPM